MTPFEGSVLHRLAAPTGTLRDRAVKGATVLVVGHASVLAFRLVRNLIIARLLTKADYGIASTFALTVTMLEMITNLSVDRIIVQAEGGDAPIFQSTAHFLQAIRGLAMAAFLFVLAWPITRLFGIPEARWAFYWLAVIPLLKGFAHADVNRFEREMVMWPKVATEVVPQVLITLAAWPLAAWLKDYSALLWLLIASTALSTAGTHVFAKRPYRMTFSASHIRDMLAFAWPLLLNGVLMFAILQGDRYIVGAAYSMEALAVYSVAVTLVMAFQGILYKTSNTLMLPVLAKAQNCPHRFQALYELCSQTQAFSAALFAAILILIAPRMVPMLYGDKYADAGRIVAWFAAAQAFQLVRVGPALAAMAKGDTRCLLVSNILRSSSVVVALAAGLMHADLVWIAVAGVLGEFPAILIAVVWLSRRQGLKPAVCLKPALLPFTVVVISIVIDRYLSSDGGVVAAILAAGLLMTLSGVWLAVGFPNLRRHLYAIVTSRGKMKGGILLRNTSPAPVRLLGAHLLRCKASRLLLSLYKWHGLRRFCIATAKRWEGGELFSATLREILARYHGVGVGAYSCGWCMVPGAFPPGVEIGRYVSVADGVKVFLKDDPLQCVSTSPLFFSHGCGLVSQDTIPAGRLIIEHDAWIGANAIVTPGCRRIGLGAVVAAGAVVTKDVPDFAIVAGVPARLLRYRFDEAVREALLTSRWWDGPLEECIPHLRCFTEPITPENVAQHPFLHGLEESDDERGLHTDS
jgi:acetyltransferase-like isoleucine patch superfamily enzyme/O-antigen/teichoic acid export membrane protein